MWNILIDINVESTCAIKRKYKINNKFPHTTLLPSKKNILTLKIAFNFRLFLIPDLSSISDERETTVSRKRGNFPRANQPATLQTLSMFFRWKKKINFCPIFNVSSDPDSQSLFNRVEELRKTTQTVGRIVSTFYTIFCLLVFLHIEIWEISELFTLGGRTGKVFKVRTVLRKFLSNQVAYSSNAIRDISSADIFNSSEGNFRHDPTQQLTRWWWHSLKFLKFLTWESQSTHNID